jgi:DNA polymerase V
MKAKKIVELKTHYSFEAPILPAAIPAGNFHTDASEKALDLNEFLAPKPKNIFLVRVNGESMIEENIFDGDILVVDSSQKPRDGLVVIAALNGEMAVKTYRIIDDKVYLFAANKKFLPIEIGSFMHFEIQGVVKHVIHNLE